MASKMENNFSPGHRRTSGEYSTPPRKSVRYADKGQYNGFHEPLHSTPKTMMNSTSPSNGGAFNGSSSARRSLSPSFRAKYAGDSQSRPSVISSPKGYSSELESATIQKQRKELQLLILELKDRDQELNDMVAAHQKQLLAWEEDRQRVLTLEQRCSRLEGDVHSRTEQVKALTTKIKCLESSDLNKSTALESTQQQLATLSEKNSHTAMHLHELEDANRSMGGELMEMSSTVGQLEAREQELLTMLKLKDKDLIEASNHISELSTKLKRLDVQYKECVRSDTESRRQLGDWKQKHAEARKDIDRLNGELTKNQNESQEQHIEKEKFRQEISELEREITLSAERERRKDQLIDLQKSKQERADSELNNLRQLYDRQQMELSLLHLNLESSKDLIAKQQSSYNEDCNPERPSSRSSQQERPASRNSSVSSPSPSRSPHKSHSHSINSAGDHEELFTPLATLNGDEDFILPAVKDGESSPTSKLHRLLTESREMVKSLEKSTLPPYVKERSKSSLSQDE